jgi:hypothetical protein
MTAKLFQEVEFHCAGREKPEKSKKNLHLENNVTHVVFKNGFSAM